MYKIRTAIDRETKLQLDGLRRRLIKSRKWLNEPALVDGIVRSYTHRWS